MSNTRIVNAKVVNGRVYVALWDIAMWLFTRRHSKVITLVRELLKEGSPNE